MLGEWIISGAICVNRVLTDAEVAQICRVHGYEPQKKKVEIRMKKKYLVTFQITREVTAANEDIAVAVAADDLDGELIETPIMEVADYQVVEK